MNKKLIELTENLRKLIAIVLIFLITSLLIMLLWNSIITNIFSLKSINYFEAMGLRVLNNIFLSNVNNGISKINKGE